jgi:hypothetical protein
VSNCKKVVITEHDGRSRRGGQAQRVAAALVSWQYRILLSGSGALTLLHSVATAAASNFGFGFREILLRRLRKNFINVPFLQIIVKWNSQYCMLNWILHNSEASSHNHAHIACEIYS